MRKTMKLGVFAAALLIGGAGCKKDEKTDETGAKKATGSEKGTDKATDKGTDKATGAATGDTPKEPDQAGATGGEALAAQYEACWGHLVAKKFDEFKGCFADDVEAHMIDTGEPPLKGADAVVERGKALTAAFSDLKATPQLILVEDKNVTGVWLLTGTHDGALKGSGGAELPATNKKIGMLLVHHIEVNDQGKAVKMHELMDQTTFFGQLGLAPEGVKFRPVIETGIDKIVAVQKKDETETKNLEAAKAEVEAFNAHDAAKFGELYTEDAVWSSVSSEKDDDKKEMLAGAEELWKGADAKLTPVSTSAYGDFVSTMGEFNGKVGDKALKGTYVQISHYKDGKVDRGWLFQNSFALAAQMGLVEEFRVAGGGDQPADGAQAGGGDTTAAAGDLESTGAAECDELLKIQACMSKSVPEALQAVKDSVKMWKDALSNEASRQMTIDACKQALDQTRDAAKSLGC